MIKSFLDRRLELLVVTLSGALAILASAYAFSQGWILSYGDAESHINIAKRVMDGLTPGFAQLGGIWLPLPHLLMVPFIKWDPLWHTGLGGSIVSGLAYVFSALLVFKITLFLSKNKFAGVIAAAVFALNLNVLYLQATPMGELSLIVFSLASIYYLLKFLGNGEDIPALIFAAFFGLAASLSRYDGWLLVGFEAGVIVLRYLFHPGLYRELEGKLILFLTLAFVGILLWFAWDGLILGNPLYFINSAYSAKSQQNNWLARGELPAYKNIINSVSYYSVTSVANIGVVISALALLGLILLVFDRRQKQRFLAAMLFLFPFVFYVVTLYLGQSVIFIPALTPASFEWRLFNVRYGVMMVPFAAILVGYLIARLNNRLTLAITLLLVAFGLYYNGFNINGMPVTLVDGTSGLSAAKHPDAQAWLAQNYDYGLVLVDDYARTVSIAKTGFPMQRVIYVGNKPYWEESLTEPEKYARWIVMQKNDAVWTNIYDRPDVQGRLFKYFQKVYTSPDILVFRRVF